MSAALVTLDTVVDESGWLVRQLQLAGPKPLYKKAWIQ